MIKLVGDYWIDENENKWSAKAVSEEKALKYSESLINSYRCTDCLSCRDCCNCSSCISCKMCSECDSCIFCENCFLCISCVSCKCCLNCDKCESCDECSTMLQCHSCCNSHKIKGYGSTPFTYHFVDKGQKFTFIYGKTCSGTSIQVIASLQVIDDTRGKETVVYKDFCGTEKEFEHWFKNQKCIYSYSEYTDLLNQFKSVALEKEKSKMINNDLMIEDITDAQALLEEKIIECFSEDGSELNMRISALIIHYILGEWENDYVSNEARINLKEIDNVYHKFLANDFTLEEPLSLDLSVKQKEYCVVVRPFFRYVVSILEEIEIEKYDISYNEFLNALDNATNILYM